MSVINTWLIQVCTLIQVCLLWGMWRNKTKVHLCCEISGCSINPELNCQLGRRLPLKQFGGHCENPCKNHSIYEVAVQGRFQGEEIA